MTMFEDWAYKRFDNLSVPGDDWRLDLLLKPGRNPATGKLHRGFETLDECWAEDQRRASALRRLPTELYDGVDGCDPTATAELLSQAAEARRIEKCSASAAYIRDRRLAFLGSILRLVQENPRIDVGLISVTHRAWYFNLRHNWSLLGEIHAHFYELLDHEVSCVPGFIITCLSGRYDPNARNIQLIFRGICGGEKLRGFYRLEDQETTPRMFEWDIYTIKNLPRQLSAMMPNQIVEWPGHWGSNSKNVRRMREPYHSIYLMRLAHDSLLSLVFTQGIEVDKDNRLMIETIEAAT
jgi:hypothetical protein